MRRLVDRAAGNPFFTEELLAAGAQSRVPPASVRDVLLARIGRLPEVARQVLAAAAVIGRVVPHDVLAGVFGGVFTAGSGDPGRDLDRGLSDVLDHRFLEPADDSYAFRHPLIQETVHADLLPSQRQALHASAAAVLSGQRPPELLADRAGRAVQVAAHWRAAGDTARAVAAAVQAGRLATAARAPAEAFEQYRHALAGWPAVPDAAALPAAAGVDETTLLELAAEAASAAGDNATAQQLAGEVLDRIDATREPVRAALRLERLGRFSWLAGNLSASWQAYEQALRVVPDAPSPARARVLAATAQSLMLRCRHLACRVYAEQAVEVATAVATAGASAELAHATDTLGTSLASIGRHAEGIAMIEAAADLASRAGDDTEVARCYVNLTEMLAVAHRPADAVLAGERGVRASGASGLGRVHASPILGSLLEGLYQLGRWDEIGGRVGEALLGDPEPWGTVPLHAPWCRVAIARGDLGLAGEQLAAMAAVPGAARDVQFAPVLSGLRAALACRRGDFSAARLAAADGLAVLDETDGLGGYLELAAAAVRIEADEIDAARASGLRTDPAAARARAERVLAGAAAMTDRIVAGGGALSPPFELLDAVAKAHLSRIPGPADPRLWQRVTDDPLADRYLRGFASYQHAAALLSLRTGRKRAVTALRTAAAIAAELGAQPLLAEIETLARHARIDLASGPPAPAAPDPLGLTPREREVITLLDHGMSNAQIASTLYVSEKTASVHVSNIMRKLGVTSRLQAARAAHGTGDGPA